MYQKVRIPIDPSTHCPDALEFEEELRRRVVGQEEAVVKTTEIIQKFMADLNDAGRPVGNVLLLGPTGTGKTRLVEAVCEVMFGDPHGMVRIDCAEFKKSHETAKIIGAPPGYVGHDYPNKQITQEKLDKTHNEEVKLSVLLLDEIEKASEDFWELLLGILDKGRLTDNKGNVIDFTKTLIFMTSNLGAREVVSAMDGGIGFTSECDTDDASLKKISAEAAANRFSPEFMNRLDQVITFNHLDQKCLQRIFEIEAGKIQKRVLASKQVCKFVFTCSDSAKEFLIKEGTNKKYGARYLKRTLEKNLVIPISTFMLTGQVELGDLVEVDLEDGKITFNRIPAEIITESKNDKWKDFRKASDE